MQTGTEPAESSSIVLSPRFARVAFVASFGVVLVAALAAIALLIAAWQGW